MLPSLQALTGKEWAEREDDMLVRTHDGRSFNCAYCADVEAIKAGFAALGPNTESVGQLLCGFFRRYAREFDYMKGVASVRTGTFLTKREKIWMTKEQGFKGDRHLFCIEDPFELTHDLGRVMDRDTLKDVKAEIERADTLCAGKGTWEKLVEEYVAPKGKAAPKPTPAQTPPAPPAPPPPNLPAAFPPL